MLSGVALIVVMMFAVLGVYFLSDTLARLWCGERPKNTVILLAADSPEEMWSGVLNIRSRFPSGEIIVLHKKDGLGNLRLEASMKGVRFATVSDVGEVVCRCFGTQESCSGCEKRSC